MELISLNICNDGPYMREKRYISDIYKQIWKSNENRDGEGFLISLNLVSLLVCVVWVVYLGIWGKGVKEENICSILSLPITDRLTTRIIGGWVETWHWYSRASLRSTAFIRSFQLFGCSKFMLSLSSLLYVWSPEEVDRNMGLRYFVMQKQIQFDEPLVSLGITRLPRLIVVN